MNLLPQASGTRPRLACEITPAGVVAARAESALSGLSAVARASLAPAAVQPGLKPGNIADRVEVVAALRQVMEEIGVRPSSRGADLTLVIPDAAVRVLLLDFDALPNKLSEALPIVRFRLKKLLPFDADDAMISYQVMSTSKTLIRVLAVAVPRDVLAEYESAVREAGYEPGAVLPSTLACVAALDDAAEAELLVNASRSGVTTAIVRSGVLLLHRSVDLQAAAEGIPANVPPALVDASSAALRGGPAQDHSRFPYASVDPAIASSALVPDIAGEPHASIAVIPESMQDFAVDALREFSRGDAPAPETPELHLQDPFGRDIVEAVSVANAYYEDTLASAPQRILSAGPLGAEALRGILESAGASIQVRELVDAGALLSGAVTSAVPRNWLAGVLGGLRG